MSLYSTQVHGVPSTKEADYLDGWRRERAEFQNFRKRLEGRQSEYTRRAKATAVGSLLNLADSFQAVVKHIPKEVASHSWTQGVQHVARQFEQLLQDQGVAVISETNVPFNPAVHEAIEQIKNKEIKSGIVLEVIQPGYKLGEHILKPARVKISA